MRAEDELVALAVRLQHVRPTAGRVLEEPALGVVGRRRRGTVRHRQLGVHDREVRRGHDVEERRVRRLERDDDREVVRRVDARDAADEIGRRTGEPAEPLPRPLHVGRRQRHAVGEHDVGPERERVDGAVLVDLPGLGQARLERVVGGVDGDQRLVHRGHVDLARVAVARLGSRVVRSMSRAMTSSRASLDPAGRPPTRRPQSSSASIAAPPIARIRRECQAAVPMGPPVAAAVPERRFISDVRVNMASATKSDVKSAASPRRDRCLGDLRAEDRRPRASPPRGRERRVAGDQPGGPGERLDPRDRSRGEVVDRCDRSLLRLQGRHPASGAERADDDIRRRIEAMSDDIHPLTRLRAALRGAFRSIGAARSSSRSTSTSGPEPWTTRRCANCSTAITTSGVTGSSSTSPGSRKADGSTVRCRATS